MDPRPSPLSPLQTLRTFALESGRIGRLHALHTLPALGLGDVSRLPVSLRILLESMLRHMDGERVTEEQVRALCRWQPRGPRTTELPVLVARNRERYGFPKWGMQAFARLRVMPPDAQGRPQEGGRTLLQPDDRPCTICEAAMACRRAGTPVVVVAGLDCGSGSSRDGAAKGTPLLGVRAVLARSFERIHRSNLVGMGVMPLQFAPGDSAASLGLRGDECLDLPELDDAPRRGQQVTVRIRRPDGSQREIGLLLRIDTPAEQAIFADGGLLPHVMRRYMRPAPAPS